MKDNLDIMSTTSSKMLKLKWESKNDEICKTISSIEHLTSNLLNPFVRYLNANDEENLKATNKHLLKEPLLTSLSKGNHSITLKNSIMATLFSQIPKSMCENTNEVVFGGDLYKNVDNRHIRAITQCKNLKTLNLHGQLINERGVEIINNNFPKLEHLDLSCCDRISTLIIPQNTTLKKIYINDMKMLKVIEIRNDIEYIIYNDINFFSNCIFDNKTISFKRQKQDGVNVDKYRFENIDTSVWEIDKYQNNIIDILSKYNENRKRLFDFIGDIESVDNFLYLIIDENNQPYDNNVDYVEAFILNSLHFLNNFIVNEFAFRDGVQIVKIPIPDKNINIMFRELTFMWVTHYAKHNCGTKVQKKLRNLKRKNDELGFLEVLQHVDRHKKLKKLITKIFIEIHKSKHPNLGNYAVLIDRNSMQQIAEGDYERLYISPRFDRKEHLERIKWFYSLNNKIE